MIVLFILFWLSVFIIFWAMIGYPISLKVIKKIYRNRVLIKDYSYEPTVTIMVVAHNEEKVIWQKLENLIRVDYSRDKLEILVTSDNSTDKTNGLVKEFKELYPDHKIRLYEVLKRMGKTNAQNEAQKTVTSEILVMTDANSMLDKNAISELVSCFTSDNIAYVTGCLKISNKNKNDISSSEATYWDRDMALREIESNIQTITAGNGAIYACRNVDYHDFDPIKCHDSYMPIFFALQGKRAIYNPQAIAYEKAGEVIEDEFKRKVRMSRGILWSIIPSIKTFNFFKYNWYSYFYFGHRTCRYLLWITHLIALLSNALIVINGAHIIYLFALIMQLLFFMLAAARFILRIKTRITNIIYYYCMTILAQWIGVINIFTGKSKPFWDKAESTR